MCGKTAFQARDLQPDDEGVQIQIPRKNAMDDTIIIFLFPQLKGQGSEYEKQLLGVKEVFEKIGYPRSAFAIERIINRHFHNSYDFFA